jgi:pyruvate dehydrogenase E1 component
MTAVPRETSKATGIPPDTLRTLRELERKVLWLSSWMIHNANHLRDKRDGLKVGGHQASSASVVTLMTALYFHVLRPEDRVAVKPHASPIFHAIQYLLGHQSREKLERFRALGGAQSYPSRTKDGDEVDFSTGSVGLGVAVTVFAALVQDYVRMKTLVPEGERPGRMVAIVGDAELDEGNVFEAMLEGWKHDVRNVWWVIDYNRQSLDNVVSDRLFARIDGVFESMGWKVFTLKYGKLLEAAFKEPGGDQLRKWIDDCPNSLYSALTYKGGAAWREHLLRDLGDVPGIRAILDRHDDAELHRLMTNLAGHDMETVLEAFEAASASDEPICFIAYTVKGFGLPFAGHKDNHAGLMSPEQMAAFKTASRIADGREWERFAGLDMPVAELERFLAGVPFAQRFPRQHETQQLPLPDNFPMPRAEKMSTQEGFGRILYELAAGDSPLASRLVTTSPDVTISTNLGGWVNRRGIFDRRDRKDVFREEKVVSAQLWAMGQHGQHIELGIAEHNLFLLLAALGLSAPVFGARLLPIGTLYDPFINRGLDALNYACYQDARFIVVATPSGITLAPEGGAHQSINTPLVGMGQAGLTYFEPAFVDELSTVMAWSLRHMQAEEGGSVYLRLSTRTIDQPQRIMTPDLQRDITDGAYWLRKPGANCDIVIAYTGAVAPEAIEAVGFIGESHRDVGLLAVTSADRLHSGWTAARKLRRDRRGVAHLSHIEQLLAPLPRDCGIVTVIDGHPAALGWLGSVRGHRVEALGVEQFGQTGTIADLYRHYGIDANAIIDAAESLTTGAPVLHRKMAV